MTHYTSFSRRLLLARFFGSWAFATGFLIFYYRQLGFSFMQIFLLSVVYEGLNFLLEIPTGVLADLWSVKKTIVLGHFISAASFFLIALRPDKYAVFVIWSILSAICTTLNSGAMDSFLYETIRREDESGFPRFQGRLTATGLTTSAVTMVLGGLLTSVFGFQVALILSGLGGLIQTAILASFPDPTPVIRMKPTGASVRQFLAHTGDSFLLIWKTPDIRYVTLLSMLVFILMEFFRTVFQPALIQIGITSTVSISLITAGSMIIGSLIAEYTGKWMERLPLSWVERLLVLGCVLPLLFLIRPVGTLPAILLYSAVVGFAGTALPVINNRLAPSANRSTIYSTQNQLASIGYAGFAVIAGAALDAFPLWMVAGLAGSISLALFISVFSRHRLTELPSAEH